MGYLAGPDNRIVRFAGGDPLAGVAKDAGNNKYRPGNSAQWSAVRTVSGIPSIPNSAHDFVAPSGNIPDLVGSHPLVVSGSPDRAVAIAGVATTGIGGNGTGSNQFAQATGVGNPNTTETVLLGYCKIDAPVGTTVQRMYQGGASNNAFEGLSGSSTIRYRVGAGAITGGTNHVALGLFPIVVVRRAGFNLAYSNVEKIKIATAQTPTSATVFQVGFATSGVTGSITVWNYAARFEGAAAAWGGASPTEASIDQQVRDLLETLGWTVSGYGS
jgi:hypothetical protein